MKTFEDRQEFFSILNKMWDLFSMIAKVDTNMVEIVRYQELKDRASKLLSKDAQ